MDLQKLIPVINKLQDVFSTIRLDESEYSKMVQVPQIVVIGEQSSGKSSVLENLVGRSCFPRGTGIVTRCPIVLQLIQVSPDDEVYRKKSEEFEAEEWCEFPHLHPKATVVTDFGAIHGVISSEVDKRAGTQKGIVMDELVVKIYSPYVTNLTVVDLPGIVRVPMGDQPLDIEIQVKSLLTSYMENPNSIILAVSAAANDIATAESLKLARSVDPYFDRTVVVITKLDLMDHGTDATDVLTGKVFDVKLGIIGVVNRSYDDLKRNKSISDSIEDEAAFLNKKYPAIASVHGTPYLRQRLQQILMDHIKKCLPSLQSRLAVLKVQAESDLKALGGDVSLNKPDILMDIINKFSNSFEGAIMGQRRDIEIEHELNSERLSYIFEEVLVEKVKCIDPSKDLNDTDILKCIRNSIEFGSSIVSLEPAFKELSRIQIRRLVTPAMECASLIDTEMLNISHTCMLIQRKEMERFPLLKEAIQAIVNELLQEHHQLATDLLENYVKVQTSFIYTSQKTANDENVAVLLKNVTKKSKIFHKLSFFGLGRSSSASSANGGNLSDQRDQDENSSHARQPTDSKNKSLFGRGKSSGSGNIGGNGMGNDPFINGGNSKSSGFIYQVPLQPVTQTYCADSGGKHEDQCAAVRKLVGSYFEIVKVAFLDYCPKAIAHAVIYYMKENIRSELIKKLFPCRAECLIQENTAVAEKRAKVAKSLKALEAANEIIKEIQDPNY